MRLLSMAAGLRRTASEIRRPGPVTDGQNDAVLKVGDGAQEARDFVLAQHDGKLLCLAAGGDVVLDDPSPLEGDGEEKPQRGYGDND